MAFENLSNEQLVNMVINTAHRVSILSESNDLIDLREELTARLTKRAPDVMPCGHPLAEAYEGEDGGTYCRICESA